MATKKEISHVIEKHIAVLSESKRGWTKEINLVSWNGNTAKYDIREWDPDHKSMGRGITLTDEEAKALVEALSDLKQA